MCPVIVYASKSREGREHDKSRRMQNGECKFQNCGGVVKTPFMVGWWFKNTKFGCRGWWSCLAVLEAHVVLVVLLGVDPTDSLHNVVR